jgi:hypothetical protein
MVRAEHSTLLLVTRSAFPFVFVPKQEEKTTTTNETAKKKNSKNKSTRTRAQGALRAPNPPPTRRL